MNCEKSFQDSKERKSEITYLIKTHKCIALMSLFENIQCIHEFIEGYEMDARGDVRVIVGG